MKSTLLTLALVLFGYGASAQAPKQTAQSGPTIIQRIACSKKTTTKVTPGVTDVELDPLICLGTVEKQQLHVILVGHEVWQTSTKVPNQIQRVGTVKPNSSVLDWEVNTGIVLGTYQMTENKGREGIIVTLPKGVTYSVEELYFDSL